MDKDQDRIRAIGAPNVYDLPSAAQRELNSFLHPVRRHDLADVGDHLPPGRIGVGRGLSCDV